MSFKIEVFTFLDKSLFDKLSQRVSEDIQYHLVESIDELTAKALVVTDDTSFQASDAQKVIYVSADKVEGMITISPEVIVDEKTYVLNEIERYFGVPQTPAVRSGSEFKSLKQYKITSRFSLGYYFDLINFKVFESDFDISKISSVLLNLLNELVINMQCIPIELELLMGDKEAMFRINASAVHINESFESSIASLLSNDFSFYSLKTNSKRGQFDLRFSLEKQRTYLAHLNYELSTAISKSSQKEVILNDSKIVDHTNHHEEVAKKITITTLKNIVSFLVKRDFPEDDFLDNLDAYPDKAILKLLKEDDIDFIKKSVLNKDNEEKVAKAIRTSVDSTFKNQRPEEFTENFFSKVSKSKLKELIDANKWPSDNSEIIQGIKEEVVDIQKVSSYEEYVDSVVTLVSEKFDVKKEDFYIIKEDAEGTIAEEILVKSGKSMDEFVRDSEVIQMKEKLKRMNELFTQMQDKLNKEPMVVKSLNTAEDASLSTKDDILEVKSIEVDQSEIVKELQSKIVQLTKEVDLKNEKIEVMSQKVDDANLSTTEDKQEFTTLQQKYKEELVKVDSLEKEIARLNKAQELVKNSGNEDDLATKLKDAQIEVKMYKQRLKFAQSQITNLEKAKKAASGSKVSDKKIMHLEKQIDQQKVIKLRMEDEIAGHKKDNHKLSQDNKMLTNKIKDLEKELAKKNKQAA